MTLKLETADRVASGQLMQSITFEVDISGDSYELSFSMEDYWRFVDEGRRPGGRMPPIEAILRWMRFKGVPVRNLAQNRRSSVQRRNTNPEAARRQAAFAIARAIQRNGVRAVPFVTSTLTPDLIDKINADIQDTVATAQTLKIEAVFAQLASP